MNEKETCDTLAAVIVADQHEPMKADAAGLGLREKLSRVFQHLRGLNIPWQKILALVGPILQILMSGGSWEQIIAAVLALFFPPAPTTGT